MGRSPGIRLWKWLQSYRSLIAAYLRFGLFVLIAFSLLVTPWGGRFVLTPLNHLIAEISALTLQVMGADVQVESSQIISARASVDIREGCNGIYATIIFLGGVIAYPTRFRKKMIGLIFGPMAIFLINLVRVVTLFFLNAHYPALFNEAHLYIWQFLIILAGALLWIVWYDKIVQRQSPPAHI